MSIVHAARRLSSRTTRPATIRPAVIRPVPATFGAGILPVEAPVITAVETDESWSARRVSAEALIAECNARDTARAKAQTEAYRHHLAARKPAGPSLVDRAWELGYQLGRAGIDASPYQGSHDEVMAFQAGHDRGIVAYQDDQRDEVEALIACWEADHGHDASEAEYAESGTVVGH